MFIYFFLFPKKRKDYFYIMWTKLQTFKIILNVSSGGGGHLI
jgi:hypothetical protein